MHINTVKLLKTQCLQKKDKQTADKPAVLVFGFSLRGFSTLRLENEEGCGVVEGKGARGTGTGRGEGEFPGSGVPTTGFRL